MYILNGIAYAGDSAPMLKVTDIVPTDDYGLRLTFSTGEVKIFDFSVLLHEPAFVPLADKELFRTVAIEYGIPVWLDGEIDIAPEYLYEQSRPI